MHLITDILEGIRLFSAIFETMQLDLYPVVVKRLDFVEYIHHAPVIGRVGNIERDDVEPVTQDVREYSYKYSIRGQK